MGVTGLHNELKYSQYDKVRPRTRTLAYLKRQESRQGKCLSRDSVRLNRIQSELCDVVLYMQANKYAHLLTPYDISRTGKNSRWLFQLKFHISSTIIQSLLLFLVMTENEKQYNVELARVALLPVLCVMTLASITGSYLLWQRRKAHPITGRSVVYIIFCNVGEVLYAVVIFFRDTEPGFSCAISQLFTVVLLTVIFASFFVQMWVVMFRFELAISQLFEEEAVDKLPTSSLENLANFDEGLTSQSKSTEPATPSKRSTCSAKPKRSSNHNREDSEMYFPAMPTLTPPQQMRGNLIPRTSNPEQKPKCLNSTPASTANISTTSRKNKNKNKNKKTGGCGLRPEKKKTNESFGEEQTKARETTRTIRAKLPSSLLPHPVPISFILLYCDLFYDYLLLIMMMMCVPRNWPRSFPFFFLLLLFLTCSFSCSHSFFARIVRSCGT